MHLRSRLVIYHVPLDEITVPCRSWSKDKAYLHRQTAALYVTYLLFLPVFRYYWLPRSMALTITFFTANVQSTHRYMRVLIIPARQYRYLTVAILKGLLILSHSVPLKFFRSIGIGFDTVAVANMHRRFTF